MDMDRLVTRASKWMEGTGPQGDVVLTSRIRLARNIKGLPSPLIARGKASGIDSAGFQSGEQQIGNQNLRPHGTAATGHIVSLQKQILVEKHLISPALVEMDRPRAVILNPMNQ